MLQGRMELFPFLCRVDLPKVADECYSKYCTTLSCLKVHVEAILSFYLQGYGHCDLMDEVGWDSKSEHKVSL